MTLVLPNIKASGMSTSSCSATRFRTSMPMSESTPSCGKLVSTSTSSAVTSSDMAMTPRHHATTTGSASLSPTPCTVRSSSPAPLPLALSSAAMAACARSAMVVYIGDVSAQGWWRNHLLRSASASDVCGSGHAVNRAKKSKNVGWSIPSQPRWFSCFSTDVFRAR